MLPQDYAVSTGKLMERREITTMDGTPDDNAGGPHVLLTGATGYVGGRLLTALEARGHRVRCLARHPEALEPRVAPGTEVAAGDVLDSATLGPALADAGAAYYLVHSMGRGKDFEELDRRAAQCFADAARESGVGRIIYLGGLGEESEDLSAHLRSRHEVGHVLRDSGVCVIELRASIVVGAGSLSFETMGALVDRLPVMVTPRWVGTLCQPIAIDDVIAYLLAALELPSDESAVFEIGGADQVSYGDLMREYARQRGLRRLMIPVPVLTPWLSSLWLALVTPARFEIGRRLIEGLRAETVVRDERALEAFGIRPVGVRDAISRALADESV